MANYKYDSSNQVQVSPFKFHNLLLKCRQLQDKITGANLPEEQRLEKKMKTCERLGALEFQSLVFKVEELSFKLGDKVPIIYKLQEKIWLDWKMNKKLKKATNNSEKEKICESFRVAKLKFRKAIHEKRNVHYHVNMNAPTEIISYLEWNKEVHQGNLKRNIAFLSAGAALTATGIAPTLGAITFGIKSLAVFKDFQCVNLQNYNLCRLKQQENKLQTLETKKIVGTIHKYGDFSNAIASITKDKKDIPTTEDALSIVMTDDMREQILKATQERIQLRKKLTNKGGKGK